MACLFPPADGEVICPDRVDIFTSLLLLNRIDFLGGPIEFFLEAFAVQEKRVGIAALDVTIDLAQPSAHIRGRQFNL